MKSEKGQILLEALLALTIAVIIIGAISVATINSVNNSSFSRDQNLATQYAQQGMEILKEQSKTNWAIFDSTYKHGKKYCLNEDYSVTEIELTTACPTNITVNGISYFIREVVIYKTNSEGCKTTSGGPTGVTEVATSVLWSNGKCDPGNKFCNKVTLNSCFSNLENKTAP